MTFPNSPLVVPQFPGNELENAAELVNRVDIPLNEIQAYIVGMPLGLIGAATLATTTLFNSGLQTYLSVPLTYVSGRYYRCTITFVGLQGGGTTGAPAVAVGSSPSVFVGSQATFFTRASGVTIYGTAIAVFPAVSNGSTTVIAQVQASAATNLTISAGASLEVEDIGFP